MHEMLIVRNYSRWIYPTWKSDSDDINHLQVSKFNAPYSPAIESIEYNKKVCMWRKEQLYAVIKSSQSHYKS